MGYPAEVRAELLRQGKCTRCKGPMTPEDFDQKHTTCAKCREKSRQSYYVKKEYETAKALALIEVKNREKERKYAKCERCAWGTYVDASTLYCMFPNCINEPRAEPQQEGGE